MGGDYDVIVDADRRLKRTRAQSGADVIVGLNRVAINELRDIAPVFGLELPDLVPGPLRDSYTSIYGQNVNWTLALGSERFNKRIVEFARSVVKIAESVLSHTYWSTLVKSRLILSRLERSRVDALTLRTQVGFSTDDQGLTLLGGDGWTSFIRYGHNTQTGRLRVVSGPKILTMQRERRLALRSRYTDGVIASIDFSNHEPRIVKLLTSGLAPDDIYEDMAARLQLDGGRARAKLATIATLYGSHSLEPSLAKKVKEYFGIEKLQRDYLGEERLVNLYGRPLAPDSHRSRISYFVQSTGVDVALIGFNTFIDQTGAIPLFVIHDALIVDVERSTFNELTSRRQAVTIENLGEFPLRLEPVVGA